MGEPVLSAERRSLAEFHAMRAAFTRCRATVVMVALLAAGCGGGGPTVTTTKTIEFDAVPSLSADLRISAGELHVGGGASRLLEGTFRFNVPQWEPVVEYHRDAAGGGGVLSVKQPSFSPSFGHTDNSWDLRLNDSVPLTLNVHIGAGESTLTLGSLRLRGLQVDVGAGELTIDLRGTPMNSYDVKVNASVGQTNIRLPRTVAIVATATAGVGGLNVSGLQKQGNGWVNPGHEQDPIVIHVDVKGGVGQIELVAE